MLLDDGKNILAVFIGLTIGFVSGFMGGGGGTLAVIALLTLFGLEQKQSHATAILVILPVTVIAAVTYVIGGGIDYLVALAVTVGVAVGGFVGSGILNKIDNNTLKTLFALITVIAGVRMLFR